MFGMMAPVVFLLGAAHALEPGHGKALIASLLVGSRAGMRHMLLLGVTVVITHTVFNGLLALLLVSLASTVLKGSFVQATQILSGLMTTGLGLWWAYRRWQPAFSRSQGAFHDHLCCGGRHPDLALDTKIEQSTDMPVTQRDVLLTGFTSGLAPCPLVLAAMVASAAVGNFATLLLALFIFSVGMGTVLLGVGMATLLGNRAMQLGERRHSALRKAPVWLNRLSPMATVAMGLYLMFQAWTTPESTLTHAHPELLQIFSLGR
jgi:ABC-type nickel/cobalt efflux system permease component RcnA